MKILTEILKPSFVTEETHLNYCLWLCDEIIKKNYLYIYLTYDNTFLYICKKNNMLLNIP